MLIWGAKRRPSGPRHDRRNADRPQPNGGTGRSATDFLAVLREQAVLDQAQLDRLQSAMEGGRFDCLPVLATELGLIAEVDLSHALARFCGFGVLAPADLPEKAVLTDLLPPELCRRQRIVPVREDAASATVAIVDVFDHDLMGALAYSLARDVHFLVVGPAACEAALRTLYGEDSVGNGEAGGNGDGEDVIDDALDRLEDVSRRAPIIRLTNHLFRTAFEQGATDIHVEPGETELRVRYRVDGMLVLPETYQKSLHNGLSTRLKILAGLNIAERRLPQDGRMKMVDRGREVDVRVSVLPTPHGESLVLRLLGRSLAASGFEGLGLDAAMIGSIERMTERPNGLFLVTGPTGSGKTTTLYTALARVNDKTRKIITVEDPVEYRIAGVTQVQAHADIGLDFAAALRSILRQDPDIVMIGEIRDAETARIAVQASLTGHLVLSTLHTNSAAATITRLIDMGLQPYLLAAVLNGVVAQRLLRLLCDACKTETPATYAERRLVARRRPEYAERPLRLARPVGCPHCAGTGYRGRTVVAEVLDLDRTARSMIADGASEAEIEAHAHSLGMRSLASVGIGRVIAGDVCIEDVLRNLDLDGMPDLREAVS